VIPRDPALPTPTGPRYWSHDLGDRGAHHFRMPRYTLALGVSMFAAERGAISAEGMAEKMVAHLPVLAAAIGIAWHNRGVALVTPPPEAYDPATLAAYAEAVLDELQDEYDLIEIQVLGTSCLEGITSRLNVAQMAGARAAGFLPAVEAPPADPDKASADASNRKRSSI